MEKEGKHMKKGWKVKEKRGGWYESKDMKERSEGKFGQS